MEKITKSKKTMVTSDYRAHANTSGDYAHANTSGEYAHANTSGDDAHANTSGDDAHANTSGYRAHANTSGDYAHANTSGDEAHSNTSGKNSIAAALGIKSKSRAEQGAIVIADWRYIEGEWKLIDIHAAMVGKKIKDKTIKAGVWYWFEKGELKSEA